MAAPRYNNPGYTPTGYADYDTCAAANVDLMFTNAAANGGFTADTVKKVKLQQAAKAASKGPDPNADYGRAAQV